MIFKQKNEYNIILWEMYFYATNNIYILIDLYKPSKSIPLSLSLSLFPWNLYCYKSRSKDRD